MPPLQSRPAMAQRFFRLEVLAGQAARGPWSVSKSVVPFDSLACALFWRRRAWGEVVALVGGLPALAERAGGVVVRRAAFFGVDMSGPGLLSLRKNWSGRALGGAAALLDGLALDTEP